MTLLLRRVSVGIELPCHWVHAYIYQTHYTLVVSGCWFHLGNAYLHILSIEKHAEQNTTPVRDFCHIRFCQFTYLSVRVPHGPRRIWKTLKIPVRGAYDDYTGIARGTRGVLRIIRPNHKCTAVSSCTGPVTWCDHENSTDVKFLRAPHSA